MYAQAPEQTLRLLREERFALTRFHAYRPVGGGWIAPEVIFLLDGREYMREDYFDVEVDRPHAPATFDPARWGAAESR